MSLTSNLKILSNELQEFNVGLAGIIGLAQFELSTTIDQISQIIVENKPLDDSLISLLTEFI